YLPGVALGSPVLVHAERVLALVAVTVAMMSIGVQAARGRRAARAEGLPRAGRPPRRGHADADDANLPSATSRRLVERGTGLLQVRLVGAGEPVRIRPQTRVDRFLASPQRVYVGTIG